MRYRLLITLLFTTQYIFCQFFEWNAGFHGFFDNREYFNEYTTPQTIFGSRIYFDLGFEIKEHHHFKGGLNYMYEFGSKGEYIEPDLIMYYNFNNKIFNLYMGAFPRKDRIRQPDILLKDTLNYYRTNAEGFFVEFFMGRFSQSFWIDWISRQTETKNEAFLLGGSGFFKTGIFLLEEHFQMHHHAGAAKDTFHLRDNAGGVLLAGLDLSSLTVLDSLAIKTGYSISLDRQRHIYDLRDYHGSLTEFIIQYKGFGIKETIYIGNGQIQLYGDGFYRSDIYNRLDFYVYPLYKKNIDLKFQYSIHNTPSKTDFSGYVHVYINFGGRTKVKSEIEN